MPLYTQDNDDDDVDVQLISTVYLIDAACEASSVSFGGSRSTSSSMLVFSGDIRRPF